MVGNLSWIVISAYIYIA